MNAHTQSRPSKAWSSTAVAGAAGLLLSGCAVNPLVSWNRPPPEASPVSLEFAQRYADLARASYQEKRHGQVQTATTLNAGLLGLGIIGTGLAVAKTHRDGLIGTALLGGSAYAFGQQNLNPQYLKVYEAGIDAIGCARQAVTPLVMSRQRHVDLTDGIKSLNRLATEVATRRAEATGAVQAALKVSAITETEAAEPRAAIAAAGTAVDASNTLVRSGLLVLGRSAQAGERLVNAVESIDAAVNRALTATLPDPASVFKIIPGLAGFAGGIVPGTDAAIRDALTNAQAALKSKSISPPAASNSFRAALRDKATPDDRRVAAEADAAATAAANKSVAELNHALAVLAQATQSLLGQMALINGLLPTEDALAGMTGLQECGVANLAFPLKATPEKPSLVAGAARRTSFMLEGGTKPYVARLLTTPLDGVTVTSPVPFDSTVSVDITDKVTAQTFGIQITDSSTPARSITVSFEVKPKP